MPVVWFIRHGQSESNADLRTSHPADSALTPIGHEESRLISNALSQPPDLFVLSPFLRARQTAVPTLDQYPHHPETPASTRPKPPKTAPNLNAQQSNVTNPDCYQTPVDSG